MTPLGDAPRLGQAISIAQRRRGVIRGARALGRWWGVALAVVLVTLAVDASAPLAWWLRVGVLAATVLLLVVGIVAAMRSAWLVRRTDARRVLIARLESAWGMPAGVLINADDFVRTPVDDPLTRALAQRSVTSAEAILAASPRTAPVDRLTDAIGVWRVAGVCLAGLTVFAVGWGDALAITAQRLIDPLGDHPAYAPTRLVARVADGPVLLGDRVDVRVEVDGERPGEVWLTVDGTVRVPLAPDGAGGFSGEIGPVIETIELRAHSARTMSRMLRVEPVPLARVVSSSVRVLPPSHAAECAPVRDAGDPVRAVVGSVVEFRLSTSSPCIGLRTPDGRLVGEVDGARVTVRRPVTGDDTVTYTTSTVAGDGPGVFTLDVRALEDFPPTLRFVGEGVNGDTLTIVAGGSARFGVLATDDVALRSEAFDVDVPAGATVRTERVDHARSRAGVVIDGAAFTPGDRFDVVARAADTVPERAPVEERLVVEVISAEEAIARERAALTIEALAGPSERVAQALLDGDSEAVRAALDGLSNAGQSSAFAREAAEDAARLLKRVEREGLSQHAALEGERTLEDDAARLRVGDELRRWGEALVRLTDEQVALGASPDPSAEEQRAHEDRLVRIASALRTLGTRAMLAPMDQQTLVGLRASIVRARETLEGRVGAWREGEDEGPRRAHDTVITDLHFALDDLLREDAGAGDLDGAASEALRLLRRVRADAGERAAEIDGVLGLLEELVLAVRGEARPALPMMGASAVWIAQRLDEMGVRMVMVDAARAMESGEAHGRDLAREAGALLLSLREESASGGEREETGAGDAPLSLTPGASAPARASRSSSSSDGEAPGDALREALDILSANRARAGEAGAMPDAVRDGGEEANRGGARIATGGDGEGVGLGGSSVPANARTDDEGDPIDAAARAAGVQAWIVEETLELTPGEAERLAGVPEAYRSIVAAYLRAIAGGEGDRIE